MQKIQIAVAMVVVMGCSAGCGKRAGEPAAGTSEQAFNAVQYCQDFASAAPEMKTLADRAWTSIQSGAFPQALNFLNQLSANSNLTDAQKRSVAGLMEQVNKQMTAHNGAN